MNEMYEMSQNIHIYSVIALVVTVFIMMLMHKVQNDFVRFVKRITMMMALYFSLLGFVVMTGTVMMASKHLSMTPANLLMIISTIFIIVLEIRRNKALAKVVKYKIMDAHSYNKIGFRYHGIEFVLIMIVGAFSGMASAVSF